MNKHFEDKLALQMVRNLAMRNKVISSSDAMYIFNELERSNQENSELHAQIAKLQRKVEALLVENVGMDGFVAAMLHIAWHGGSADGFDIQDAAITNGLIRQDVYCSDEHETLVEDPGNFEDGDAICFRVETPATDAALSEIRAQGVEMFVNKISSELRSAGGGDGYHTNFYPELADHLESKGSDFSSELRKESGQ